MPTALELLRQGRRDQIWKKYCGFMDLSLTETMQIQERLLLEQLQLLGTSELGRRLLGGRVPKTVEEFRQNVPLTTYADYADYLEAKREDALPVKPQWWLHTSGRSGEYQYKWAPYTPQMAQRFSEYTMAGLVIGAKARPGEFVYEEGDTMLFALAPYPYTSGAVSRAIDSQFNFTFLPPVEIAEKMSFGERVQEGFRLGLRDGIDCFYGTASVLMRIGEQFAEGAGSMKLSAFFLHPKVMVRLLRALMRSRLAGRKYLLPRDLWTVKCVLAGGTDVRLFRKQIEEYWGHDVLDGFACTEGGIVGARIWGDEGMTFYPDVNFYEFIPMADSIRSRSEAGFKPSTVTLDQVQPGQRYEMVLTNLHGGVYTRYRIGDMIEFVSLGKRPGVDQPQWEFYSRTDDIIDLAAFARLTEATVWKALESAGLRYDDWTARKEYEGTELRLHICVELKGDAANPGEIHDRIDQGLRDAEPDYASLRTMLGMDPLRVTLLTKGTFQRYMLARQAEGADLAHYKPPHMNVSDSMLEKLLRASQAGA